MLGHELRNPLAPILTALQLMKLRGGEAIDRERIVVERQVRHLARLVDDLLDVSRITRGKVELREEVIEIADVVAKAIETASPLLEERRHTLAVELPRQGVTVVGDATRLGQVFGNLLTNAAKYTPEAGASRSTAASKRSRSSCASATTGWGSPATCCRISSTCSCRNGRPWIGREAVSASA
jgi:signal transduction histidine kinase